MKSGQIERLNKSVVIYGGRKIPWGEFLIPSINAETENPNLTRFALSFFADSATGKAFGHPLMIDFSFAKASYSNHHDEKGRARYYSFPKSAEIYIPALGGNIKIQPQLRLENQHLRQDSNVYAAIMVREMQEERGYVTTEPVETMIQALGEQTYDAMLTTYASSGLDSNALGTIAGKLPKTQYVALAKIDADNAKVATERTDAKETKDEKGKVTKTPPRTTKRHMRTVLVTMHVYDLGSKSLVFSGQVSKSRENSKTYDVDLVSNARALVGAARGEDNDEAIYPEDLFSVSLDFHFVSSVL